MHPDVDDQVDGPLDGNLASNCDSDVQGTIWRLDRLPDIRGNVLKVNDDGRSSGVKNYDEPRGMYGESFSQCSRILYSYDERGQRRLREMNLF